jgi:hypothetical protein
LIRKATTSLKVIQAPSKAPATTKIVSVNAMELGLAVNPISSFAPRIRKPTPNKSATKPPPAIFHPIDRS